jgi:predicted hydrolase (HD superfamily)
MEATMTDTKQIGPRIREDVYEALQQHSDKTRTPMSKMVEYALMDLLKTAGYQFENDYRY